MHLPTDPWTLPDDGDDWQPVMPASGCLAALIICVLVAAVVGVAWLVMLP